MDLKSGQGWGREGEEKGKGKGEQKGKGKGEQKGKGKGRGEGGGRRGKFGESWQLANVCGSLGVGRNQWRRRLCQYREPSTAQRTLHTDMTGVRLVTAHQRRVLMCAVRAGHGGPSCRAVLCVPNALSMVLTS